MRVVVLGASLALGECSGELGDSAGGDAEYGSDLADREVATSWPLSTTSTSPPSR